MMKSLLFFIVLGAVIVSVSCQKKVRTKFLIYQYGGRNFWDLQEKIDLLHREEVELETEIREELELEENNEIAREYNHDLNENKHAENPCADMFCGPGRECIIDIEGNGVCQCVEKCSDVEDKRRMVCSNQNNTWASDCELYRMRCFCTEKSDRCLDLTYEHLHIDYYGTCQSIQECSEEERSDFPRRMREWLFNIMRDMADREQLSDHYKRMEEIAEQNEDKKWVNAAVWRWCEMDGSPKDKSVSRHELFPLRAPLYTLEHCIAPFLDSCDSDDDHKVTLDEWTRCLELSDAQIQDIEDLCEDIQEQ